jgi:hypothetical protein
MQEVHEIEGDAMTTARELLIKGLQAMGADGLYSKTGFAREDAEAVVAWQNASCRPASDILERAKASGLYGKYIIQKADGSPIDPHADYFVLRLDTDPYARIAALEYAIQTDDQTLGGMLTKRVLDHVYSEDDQCRKRAEAWPLGMIKKLRGEVERLRDIIDRPPEEAEWMTDYHLLYSALDGPIIDAARKWHAAYRKAQNSNLTRKQENERLQAAWMASEEKSEGLAARIKELEAQRGRIEAAFLESEAYAHACMGESMPVDGEDWQAAREALEKIRSGKDD